MPEGSAGVSSSSSPRSGEGGGAQGGKIAAFAKKNKLLVYGGGGVGVLLLLSKRGQKAAGGSQATPTAQLSTGPGLSDPALGSDIGGSAPVDTGGGSYSPSGPSATAAPGPVSVGPFEPAAPATAPAVTINFPTSVPQPGSSPGTGGTGKGKGKGRGTGGKAGSQKSRGHAHPGPSKNPARPTGARFTPGPPVKPPTRAAGKPPAKPSQPHRVPPAPARSSGAHPNTQKKTAAGHRRGSPVEVESMIGAGAGVVIQGRHFPGARGYRYGAPFRNAAGEVSRPVVIDYGGRSETHVVHGNGDEWTDNPLGMNPPTRGRPQHMKGRNSAVL